ncbi:unnamed protein product [Euphydryas editha]|uniref:Uncharacterized protein n=1 Tax=Euphydryas editha TaxID=104508 RepID=A0AAU9TFG3_EUPED|nr:unnamed protein product [Euphydryas editha]
MQEFIHRKWNVLSKLVVPRVKLSCHYIISELEEIEREDNFRLKRFKELKIKKTKGSEDSKKIKDACECSSFESTESLISESENETIEEESDREIKPIEFLDQREKDYEPLKMNDKITPRNIDSSAQVNRNIKNNSIIYSPKNFSNFNRSPVDKKEDRRVDGDTCVESCMKNTNDTEKIDHSCPLCGSKTLNKTKDIELTNQKEGQKDRKNKLKSDECCENSQPLDVEDLCPVCEEEIKNIEFFDKKTNEANNRHVCKETNMKDVDVENLCSICRQNNEKYQVKNDKTSCALEKSGPACDCKRDVEFINQREAEKRGKNTVSKDKIDNNLCSACADSINYNICSTCAVKNKTKIDNDVCVSVTSSKSDVSCKCKKSIEFIDQREMNEVKFRKSESVCQKLKQEDKAVKNACSTCGNKESPTKRDHNVCGSNKSSKSEESCKCQSSKPLKSKKSCKCKKNNKFIDETEINEKTATDVKNICQTSKEKDKTKSVCSMCGNKKSQPNSDSSICGSNKSSKSEISCTCKTVKPSKSDVSCNCNKGIEFIDQRYINGKKSFEGKNVCSMCSNKTNQIENNNNPCGSNKLSKSEMSCVCKKGIEFIDQREIDGKKVIENKSVCSLCGNNKGQTKSESKVCGPNNPSKSKISCKCKKSIEFIDQREIDGKQSRESKNSCKAPKKEDKIDKNVCSVCGKKENLTKSDKSIFGSIEPSKSDTVCKCKKHIEFIDQRDIDGNKKDVCKSSIEDNNNKQAIICCKNKNMTVEKSNSGSFKSSKSLESCTCKKNIEFIDQRELEKATKKPIGEQSINKNGCPTCKANNDKGKSQLSNSCLSNIQVNTSNKSVKPVSKGSTKDISLLENSSSSTCRKENIDEFITTYKEIVTIKRLPDKFGNICDKKLIIKTKTERQVGPFNSDCKFDNKEKNTKKVKRSKSDNFSQCSSLGSNKDPKKSDSSDLVSISSQTYSVTSLNLSQGPAPCSLKNNTNSANKSHETSSSCLIKSKSSSNSTVQSCRSNKSVDSCYKIKIISKDDVCKSKNYEKEIEISPSTIIILKKILSQPSKTSCKLDKTKLKKSSKEFCCYKPDCSCDSIKLPCESKSEPKSLYEKLGEYLSNVNPFKGQAEPSDTKACANQSQSMECKPIKSDGNCSSKTKISKTRSKLSNKKCSKSKSTLNNKDTTNDAELNCSCKLSQQSLKEVCSCLKSIFDSPDVTKYTSEHQIDSKDSCSCNRSSPRTSESSLNNPRDCNCSKPKSSCNMLATKSKIQNNFSKCVSNKHSATSFKNTQTDSMCQKCSKSQVRLASDEVMLTKSKCSCEKFNLKESKNECSCSKPKSSLLKSNEDGKCNNGQRSPGTRSINRIKDLEATNCSCASSIQNVDSDNFSGVVDIASQACARCASSQDVALQSDVTSSSNYLESQSTCQTNNKKQELKEKCQCQSKSNKPSESKQTGCDCKSKKDKSSKSPCKSINLDIKNCSQMDTSVASQTCSGCGSKISRVEKKPSCNCRKPKCSCNSNDNKNEMKQECKCKSKSNKSAKSKQSTCSCNSKKEVSSKCPCKSLKRFSDTNNCSQNREKSVASQTCSRCGIKLSKTETQPSCSCRKSECKCKSRSDTSKCPCNNKKQESFKCSCKSSKQSLNTSSQNIKTSASQTCSKCGLMIKSKRERSVCNCQKSQSNCRKSEDLSKSKSSNSHIIQESSRCSCMSLKQSTDLENCSRALETKSVGSQTSTECCTKEDSEEKKLKSCSCRKSKCNCQSKKNELKQKCLCQGSKQKISDLHTNKCKFKKEVLSTQSGCTCNKSKQSSFDTVSKCQCKEQTIKAIKKSDSSKCPCKSKSKQSLNSDTCSQSSASISVASQTGSKRSSDQSRKSLRFSSDISPTRTIKSYSPVSPKGSACSLPSQDSCCSIDSTQSCLSKTRSRSEVSVASQCFYGKKDASTATRRSDRYDVRTLRLLTEKSNIKCPCHSDSSVVRVRRQNNANIVARCRSHGDQNNFFRQC